MPENFINISQANKKNNVVVYEIMRKERIVATISTTGRAEYSCAAEPPVRCGESHHSGLGEPPFVTYLACLGSNPYTSRMDLSFEGSMHSMFIL